jgi:hypothetical protein
MPLGEFTVSGPLRYRAMQSITVHHTHSIREHTEEDQPRPPKRTSGRIEGVSEGDVDRAVLMPHARGRVDLYTTIMMKMRVSRL